MATDHPPLYGFTYHHTDTHQSNYSSDLGAAAAALHGDSSSPLVVRVDVNWRDVPQQGPASTSAIPTLDRIFNEVLRDGDRALVILGTHQGPDWLHIPGSGSHAQWHQPHEASEFIRRVVTYIKDNGWLSRVAGWQVSDEPNNPALGFVGWEAMVEPLSVFLQTVKEVDNTKPTILNMYQTIPTTLYVGAFGHNPWDDLFRSAQPQGSGGAGASENKIAPNLDIMGVDIYPDQWLLGGSGQEKFAAAVEETLAQVRNAVSYGFKGQWGVLEMPGGPRAGPQNTELRPDEIASYLTTARKAGAAIIMPFQVRGAARETDIVTGYSNSYGLVDAENSKPRDEYLRAIQGAVKS